MCQITRFFSVWQVPFLPFPRPLPLPFADVPGNGPSPRVPRRDGGRVFSFLPSFRHSGSVSTLAYISTPHNIAPQTWMAVWRGMASLRESLKHFPPVWQMWLGGWGSGWLDRGLDGWLADWMAEWMVGRLVGWMVGYMITLAFWVSLYFCFVSWLLVVKPLQFVPWEICAAGKF